MASYRTVRVVAGLIVSFVAVATTSAQQTQPGNGMGAGYGNNEYHATPYPEQYNYYNMFYPAPEVRALPNLRANAVAARAQYRRAETDLSNAVADIQRQFKHSSELKDALADESAAYEDLKRAQADATEHLKNDPNYQAAVALRKRLADQISDIRYDSKTAGFEEMLAIATVKLSYSATASAMEAAAISADSRVQQARKHLVETANRVSDLRHQFDDAVRNSPDVILARKNLADIRIAALAADAAYEEAANVANIAFDYAYYLRNHPYPYVVNYPYYNYGYGNYGYQVGYPYSWQPSPTPTGMPPRAR